MLDKLDIALGMLQYNDFEMLDEVEKWQSMIINRRKPHTFRAFRIFNYEPLAGCRLCLHRFEPCEEHEAFMHPHPWPSAMIVLDGKYRMRVGASADLKSNPVVVMDEILTGGSRYNMLEPLGWHSVQPLTTCWSIMINGAPWGPGVAHEKAPTTKGKNLEEMDRPALLNHLMSTEIYLGNIMKVWE